MSSEQTSVVDTDLPGPDPEQPCQGEHSCVPQCISFHQEGGPGTDVQLSAESTSCEEDSLCD